MNKPHGLAGQCWPWRRRWARAKLPAPQPTHDAPAATDNEVDLAADYRALLESGGRVYRADPATSDLVHLCFSRWQGGQARSQSCAVRTALRGLRQRTRRCGDRRLLPDLQFRFDELQIDDPALREQTGGNFAGARSESDISGTRKNMLGPVYSAPTSSCRCASAPWRLPATGRCSPRPSRSRCMACAASVNCCCRSSATINSCVRAASWCCGRANSA